MTDLLSTYNPSAWFEAGLMTSSGAGDDAPSKKESRAASRFTKAMVVAMSSVAFAAMSLLFSDEAGAAALSIQAPPGAHVPRHEGTIVSINKSFNELFAAMERGERLVTDRGLRELADRASGARNQKPADLAAWATHLASQVKDADD